MKFKKHFILYIIIGFMILFSNLFSNDGRKGFVKVKENKIKRWAICIGINDYEDPEILDLHNARNDAIDLGETLKKYGEFDEVVVMSDELSPKDSNYPDYWKIKDKLSFLKEFIDKDDMVVFAFSGHGITEVVDGKENGCFLVADTRANNISETTIKLNDITAWLKEIGVKKTLLLIDACREELQQTKGINKKGLQAEEFENAEIAATFYATKSGWYSYEDTNGRNGAFTGKVIKGLKGDADKTEFSGNEDGIITFTELSSYVERSVSDWAVKNGKRQKPYTKIYGEKYGDLALTLYQKIVDDIIKDTESYIDDMEREYDKLKAIDASDAVAKEDKIKAWETFIKEYKNKNKYSTYGNERIKDLKEGSNIVVNGDEDILVLVEGDSFNIGGGKKTTNSFVTINDFYISKNEITFKEYDEFCKDLQKNMPDDEKWGRDKKPVINVSWKDAIKFCNWKSRKNKISVAYNEDSGELLDKFGNVTINLNEVIGYRLPTEAEWTFSAMGGKKSKGFKYSGRNNINDIAWYKNNSKEQTNDVNTREPNELGLSDMSGNVWEWVQDYYDQNFYEGKVLDNPINTFDSGKKVLKGGSFMNYEKSLRIDNRFKASIDMRKKYIGFRIAKSK